MTEPLASFVDYDGLRRALNACRDLRDVSLERMDEITGAPAGYFAKLLGPRPIKRIGLQSLGWALGGLGVRCVLVSDPEALAKVESRFVERDVPHLASVVRGGTTEFKLSRRHMSIIQAKGRRSRWENMTPKQRTKWAKEMNKSRWRKIRLRAKVRKAAAAAKTRR
jgi:hypothetical protein